MDWIELSDINQLANLHSESNSQPILIFKHSTRCPISTMALNRLEREWNDGTDITTYFLDLIAHRDISNEIAENYSIIHQSPQVLVIRKGNVVYDASHNSINFHEIAQSIS